jgi:hypothetical protein
MPSISVCLDDEELVCVRTDGYEVMSVSVSGTRVEDEFAELYMSGGSYPEQGESTHLIWLNSLPILPGQVVKVNVAEDGETSEAGKTIDELFPDEASSDPIDFKPTTEMFAELRARSSRRPGYRFEIQLSSGTNVLAETTPDEHGFGFSVLWNSHRPERASVSLHSYTIDSMEHRTPMKYHVQEHLKPGQSASVKVDA